LRKSPFLPECLNPRSDPHLNICHRHRFCQRCLDS